MREITEGESEHFAQLRRTGFYGRAGAGCIILARESGRILLPFRSNHPPPRQVEQPHTWGTWGGALDPGEDPVGAVVREVKEEAGYEEPLLDVIPLFVFNHASGFRYSNFLVVVEHEFAPDLNWETESYQWVENGHWPSPLHFGLQAMLSDRASVATIDAEVAKCKEAP